MERNGLGTTDRLIVAELGLNHQGRPDTAVAMIRAASKAGANAVKVQTYRTDDFCNQSDEMYETFKRCEIWPHLGVLKAEADRLGITFFGTPTSAMGVSELVSLGCPLIKNGSDALGNDPLITSMARTGLPVVLSVGMATHEEIKHAVEVFQEAGSPKNLTLCLCVSAYPTRDVDAHLRRLIPLQEWGPVGWSSHIPGHLDAVLAVTLGAWYIEKHFKMRGAGGPDSRWSLDPTRFEVMVDAIRRAEYMLGTDELGYVPAEEDGRNHWRWTADRKRVGGL